MREIHASTIADAVKKLRMEANYSSGDLYQDGITQYARG
jgi:hypothetical protein